MTVDTLLSYTVNHTIDLHCKEILREDFFYCKTVPQNKKKQNGSIVIKVGKW
jgi:hypothetical protein